MSTCNLPPQMKFLEKRKRESDLQKTGPDGKALSLNIEQGPERVPVLVCQCMRERINNTIVATA